MNTHYFNTSMSHFVVFGPVERSGRRECKDTARYLNLRINKVDREFCANTSDIDPVADDKPEFVVKFQSVFADKLTEINKALKPIVGTDDIVVSNNSLSYVFPVERFYAEAAKERIGVKEPFNQFGQGLAYLFAKMEKCLGVNMLYSLMANRLVHEKATDLPKDCTAPYVIFKAGVIRQEINAYKRVMAAKKCQR